MAVLKCKMCGGELNIQDDMTVVECEYCGSQQTLPKLVSENIANLYDRANHFRRNNDFDKAENIYEKILAETPEDSEAYWSLVLCRYGIEYVEDPASSKRVPTVNRAQYTSIFDDENYKSAIEHADAVQRRVYEEEAAAINEIQKGILAISQKEEPFDVFICYKETDQNGRRTRDSVIATDLYHQLTQEGFKVFFSRITLEDKLGTAYEPYIFAALNSAKVMIVLGTKPEYFNAVWVKNEWSRYLALTKQSGGKKVLIPAYSDMDPYDLPEEFSHLQALDMSKLGFMQDLIRGIKKISGFDMQKTVQPQTAVSSGGPSATSLLRRAQIFLEEQNWSSADEYCDKALDIDPENATAYIVKYCVQEKTPSLDKIADRINQNISYKKTIDNTTMSDCHVEIPEELKKKRIDVLYSCDLPKYVDERDVAQLFNIDMSFPDYVKISKYNLKQTAAKLNAERNLALAKRFAKTEEKAKLDAFEKKILDHCNKQIKLASELEANKRERLLKACEEQYVVAEKKAQEINENAIMLREGDYRKACNLEQNQNFESALKLFEKVHPFEDSEEHISHCEHQIAILKEEEHNRKQEEQKKQAEERKKKERIQKKNNLQSQCQNLITNIEISKKRIETAKKANKLITFNRITHILLISVGFLAFFVSAFIAGLNHSANVLLTLLFISGLMLMVFGILIFPFIRFLTTMSYKKELGISISRKNMNKIIKDEPQRLNLMTEELAKAQHDLQAIEKEDNK